MRLLDDHEMTGPSGAWVALAERLGVDRVHAHDVVGAVFSYCRQRHGSAPLDEDYISFLVARTSLVAKGDDVSPDRLEEISAAGSEADRMFYRALAVSRDPASLYDTFRMKLVTVRRSDTAVCGSILAVNIKKIEAGPHENLSFLWLSLFKRVSSAIADWREANPQLDTVRIRAGWGGKQEKEIRELLSRALEHAGQGRDLKPIRLIWT